MSKFKYSDGEQQINNVLNYQAQELKSIQRPDMSGVDKRISGQVIVVKTTFIWTM
jgi:hypothetical protein